MNFAKLSFSGVVQEQGPDKFEFIQPTLHIRFDLTGW